MMLRKPRERDFDKRLEKAKREKELYDREAEIREIKKSMRRFNPPTTTKVITAFLLVNFTVVEVYSMWVMYYIGDLSALYSLITTVLAESLTFAVYVAKAYAGKKQEEQVKLKREQMMLDNRSPQEEGMDETADPGTNECEEEDTISWA